MFYNAEYTRAIVGSIALHIMVALALFSLAAPMEIMPQQIIQISMVAPPPAQKAEQPKPEQKHVTKIEPKRVEKTPKKIVKKKDIRATQHVSKEAAIKPIEQVSSSAALNSAAGKTPEALPNEQTVTTTPSFDASYLRNPAPTYPSQAKRRRMEGIVMLKVMVAEDGAANSVQVAKTSGFSMLDASALDTVKRWKFIPAKRGNETVMAQVMVPVEFRLE